MTSKTENHEELKDISNNVKNIISCLHEDIYREGLKDTPNRVAKALRFLTSGYSVAPNDVIGTGIFPAQSEGMVLQRNIEFYSLCEHHLLPFFGEVHIAYIPDQKIIGLSKLGRLVNIFARRLQVQENLTFQIASALNEAIKPKGVAVYMEAQHFCMMMRGVEKKGATTVTTEFIGDFKSNMECRSLFLSSFRE